MAKSYEELRVEHNKIAAEYNKIHKTDPVKGEKLKVEIGKLYKKMCELEKGETGGDE